MRAYTMLAFIIIAYVTLFVLLPDLILSPVIIMTAN